MGPRGLIKCMPSFTLRVGVFRSKAVPALSRAFPPRSSLDKAGTALLRSGRCDRAVIGSVPFSRLGYADFAATYGLTTPAGGDQDRDGFPKVVEYALGLDPLSNDARAPGTP